MHSPAPLNVPHKAIPAANDVATPTGCVQLFMEDLRPETIVQKRLQDLIGNSKQTQRMQAIQKLANQKKIPQKPPFRAQQTTLQAVFDQESVHAALTTATGPVDNMGGTTGGAYEVKTSVGDPDRDPLVVKIKGSNRAVLASQVGIAIGIATPNSVMINAEPKVIGNMNRIGVRGLGDQTQFEVQQYADLDKIQNKPALGEKTAVSVGRIAVFDTLMGNHDRIHSINQGNLIGAIAIDNTTHDKSREAEAMMEQVIEALAESRGALIDYVEKKIAPFVGYMASYKGSDVKRLQGMQVQLAMIQEAIQIQKKSEGLRILIGQHELMEKKHTQHLIVELKRLQTLKAPDMSSPLEHVIKANIGKDRTRESLIADNIISMTEKLDKPLFNGVLARLKTIEETDFGEALASTSEAIEVLKATIAEQDQKKMEAWNALEKAAFIRCKKAWDDKFFKFYTTEQAYVGELMTQWRNANPKPLPTL